MYFKLFLKHRNFENPDIFFMKFSGGFNSAGKVLHKFQADLISRTINFLVFRMSCKWCHNKVFCGFRT